jgi:hypothetical protein
MGTPPQAASDAEQLQRDCLDAGSAACPWRPGMKL